MFLDTPEFFASCTPGLEDALLKEIPHQEKTKLTGGVTFKAPLYEGLKLNYTLRCAQRIYLHLKTVNASSRISLYAKARKIQYEKFFLSPTDTFSIISKGILTNMANHFASQVFKDAICDTCRKYLNDWRPNFDTENPTVSFYLFFKKTECFIYLDTTGKSLSDRGYRVSQAKAPLRETIARSALELINYEPEKLLIDGMTGSGTISLEALHWNEQNRGPFKYETWEFLKQEQTNLEEKKEITTHIKSFDVFPDNEVQKLLPVEKKDFFEFMPPENSSGILMLNPPYGQRLQKTDDLYFRIGRKIKNDFPRWKVGIFANSKQDIHAIGLRPTKLYPFNHGGNECYYAIFEIYPPKQAPKTD